MGRAYMSVDRNFRVTIHENNDGLDDMSIEEVDRIVNLTLDEEARLSSNDNETEAEHE